MALVFQHRLELGPTGVQRALCHGGFHHGFAGDVPHEDGGAFGHQLGAEFVQRVFALVADLRVQLAYLRRLARAQAARWLPVAFDRGAPSGLQCRLWQVWSVPNSSKREA